MPALRIPPGVVIGDTKATVLGRWHGTNLVRWNNGRMEPVGGWSRLTSSPMAVPARNALVWLDTQYQRNSAYMGDGKVYREQGGVFTDITPPDFLAGSASVVRQGYGAGPYNTDLYGTDRVSDGSGTPQPSSTNPKVMQRFPVRYALENWGEQLLFLSSVDGRVFVWDPEKPSVPYTQANGLPGNQTQDIIVTEERHLVLLGYGGMPNRVAWSGQENREDFDFTNVTGSAGFQDLETTGNLITARRVQGGVLIFSTTAVYLMTYIGAPFIYSIKKIAEGCPPVSPQAVASFASNCFWMGANSFWVYSNGTVTELPCTLGDDVHQNLDLPTAAQCACVGANFAYPEVWFFYPRGDDNGTSDNSDYAIFNFTEGWWANGKLARSYFGGSAIDNVPVGTTPDGNAYLHEQGYLDAGASRIGDVWAEATASFDDNGGVYSMTQGKVDTGTTDPKSIKFDVVARVVRNGALYPKGPYVARTDGKIDMRFTASDFDFRVTALVDALWTMGAMITDAKPRGPR